MSNLEAQLKYLRNKSLGLEVENEKLREKLIKAVNYGVLTGIVGIGGITILLILLIASNLNG